MTTYFALSVLKRIFSLIRADFNKCKQNYTCNFLKASESVGNNVVNLLEVKIRLAYYAYTQEVQ